MPRQPKGSVTVESFRGRLRLRLPRQCYQGEQKYLSLGIPDTPANKKAAEARAKEIEADIAFGRFDPDLKKYKAAYEIDQFDQCFNLNELWEKYTEYKAFELSLTTIQTDFRRVKTFLAQLEKQNLNKPRVIRDEIKKTLPPVTAKRVFLYIKACCQWGVDEEFLPFNPFAGMSIKIRHSKPLPQPFTDKERLLIIDGFRNSKYFNYYTHFVEFLFLTGCRTSEGVGLRWKNISLDLTQIRFCEAVVLKKRKGTKTGKPRVFPVNPELGALLQIIRPNQITGEESVFRGAQTPEIDPHNFLNRAWKGVLKSLPIPYRPQYNTRHTFITKCLENGVPVAQVAQWAGNSAKTIWENYAGLVNIADVPIFNEDKEDTEDE